MTVFLEIREHIKGFYSNFEIYITPVIKFILMFVTLSLINGKLGYMKRLDSSTLVLLVSLVSALLPYNFLLLASAAFMVLHIYSLSLEAAAMVLVVFVLMFLLYFRFAEGDGLLVMLTPLCSIMNIPLVIPVSAGLLRSPASAASVCCGVLINSIMDHIMDSEASLRSMDSENAVQKFRLVVDGIIDNKQMVVMMAAFGVTVVFVYIIRRLSLDYSWLIAIITGLILPLSIMMVGDLIFETGMELFPWILSAFFSFFILIILHFFAFSVDYHRTERVQFEDDEYYYYVKAVPKITLSRMDKTVKKITPGGGYQRSSQSLSRSTGDREFKPDPGHFGRDIRQDSGRSLRESRLDSPRLSSDQRHEAAYRAGSFDDRSQPRRYKR